MSFHFALCAVVVSISISDLHSYDPALAVPPGLHRIGKQSWGESQQGWKLAFALPKDVYGTNEPVRGAALIRNETDVVGTLVTNSDGDGDYATTILDEQGKVLRKQNERAAGFRSFHTEFVPAHSEARGAVDIRPWYDLAKPGLYRITIAHEVPNTNGRGQTVVFSATNTFRIVSRPAATTDGEVSPGR
jgi:hypothetical protein